MECRYCGEGIFGGKGDYWHTETDVMECADAMHKLAYPLEQTNWHNEVFEEMGWLLDANVKEPEVNWDEWYDIEVVTREAVDHGRANPQRCDLCGTRTGLHGFSFGKDGKY